MTAQNDQPESTPVEAGDPPEVVTPLEAAEPGDAPVLIAPIAAGDRTTRDPEPATPNRRPGSRLRTFRRFAAAFVFGLLAVLAVSAGALAAFESSNNGRILPGVHVGSVDLSGMTSAEARSRLNEAYAPLADGKLVLAADDTTRTVGFASIGRALDVDALVEQAMAVGRGGAAIERIAANVRNMVRGVDLAPITTLELAALRQAVEALARDVDQSPVDASVTTTGDTFVVSASHNGRAADVDAAVRAATALLTDPASPSSLRVTVPLLIVSPSVTTEQARAARDAAARIAVDVELFSGDEAWTLPGASILGWISFGPTLDGGYGPSVAQEGLEAGLAAIADDVATAPVDASFLVGNGSNVVGVTEAKLGRALDIPTTVETLVKVVDQRVDGLGVTRVPVSTMVVEPTLTTEEATKTAPLMKPISEWTTYFPVSDRNGYGANIWIPARDIDGYVVLPGATFDFWKAIGPVTRAHGYTDGGAIINGKTEPQGALAGGICSCSTTLFNAAVRAGLEMGARRNHYYYIDRYPLGLDATVFQSSSGSVQTMSFTNDTASPILIRGSGWRVGSKGYVKFVLWSVPTGRTVTFSKPLVKNVKPASDTVVYTTELKPGVKERVEYPVDGKDVWVTRVVKDSAGNVIHQETYYSHYSRITGVVRIGVAPKPAPTPAPTPSPTT